MLKGKTVLLGVTGSIAAYKTASLASMLVKKGVKVHVLMTENAAHFINPITFESLTGNKCLVDTFDRNFEFSVEHVALAKQADVVMIAPASANVIGKIAHGIADDMLTTTVMACRCKKILAPAMNTNMYENPILQDNLDICRRNGISHLAGGMVCDVAHRVNGLPGGSGCHKNPPACQVSWITSLPQYIFVEYLRLRHLSGSGVTAGQISPGRCNNFHAITPADIKIVL